MSILKIIEQYDRERDEYIVELEEDLRKEREISNELSALLSSQVASNERKTLDLIMSGHFGGMRQAASTRDEETPRGSNDH